MSDDRKPLRSPRAARNASQARVTRFVLGTLVLVILGAAGYGVTWLRKHRATQENDRREPDSRPGASETRSPVTETGPATSRAESMRVFLAEPAIAAIRARFQDGSVEGMW